MNESANANAAENTNNPSNTNSNANSGSNTSTNTGGNENNNGPLSSRALRESYGGTFTAVNSGDILWTCTGLPTLGEDDFIPRRDALANSCAHPFSQAFAPPQDATCFLNI